MSRAKGVNNDKFRYSANWRGRLDRTWRATKDFTVVRIPTVEERTAAGLGRASANNSKGSG